MTKLQAAACNCETDIAAPEEDAADLRKKSGENAARRLGQEDHRIFLPQRSALWQRRDPICACLKVQPRNMGVLRNRFETFVAFAGSVRESERRPLEFEAWVRGEAAPELCLQNNCFHIVGAALEKCDFVHLRPTPRQT